MLPSESSNLSATYMRWAELSRGAPRSTLLRSAVRHDSAATGSEGYCNASLGTACTSAVAAYDEGISSQGSSVPDADAYADGLRAVELSSY